MVLGDFETATVLNSCPDADFILLKRVEELCSGSRDITIAEFGFGDAKALFYLLTHLKKKVSYFAVEMDERAVEGAKPLETHHFPGKKSLKIIKGDLTKVNEVRELRNVKADVIILPEVLCRIDTKQWRGIFRVLRNLLKEDGCIIVIDGDMKISGGYMKPEGENVILEPVDVSNLKKMLRSLDYRTRKQEYFIDLFKARKYRRPWSSFFRESECALYFRGLPPLGIVDLVYGGEESANYRRIFNRLKESRNFHRAVRELLEQMPDKWIRDDFVINEKLNSLFRHYFILVAEKVD